ncbi:NAD(P)/FAD-dependent oxidoreductase [Streptomyces sp. NPDC088387]|uniref:NAD(P)/FAD-dependent oxidoreductase n=1 Tax=Streptomyces sp. NPDC088387 TaxID=3365859 RepID=UPI0038112A75
MDRIVVVGASAAGLATAGALRRFGYGGELTLVGDEPHLPYDRPPLSKAFLSARLPAERLLLKSPADLDALGLTLRVGRPAVALDQDHREVVLADDRIPYDVLVIATGVRPRRPFFADGPSGPLGGVHVLRTLDDARTLRDELAPGRRLVVVGAGFLGSEIAATARGLGTDVTLVEAEATPLARTVGPEVGGALTAAHLAHGVDVRTGVTVERLRGAAGRVVGVDLSDGTALDADDVVVAVGSRPNTEWLQGSGLTLDDGVVCDASGRAGRNIHAAGDVARFDHPLFGTRLRIEHRTNATSQGLAVARDILRSDDPGAFASVPYFWSDQYDFSVQAYGHLPGHDSVTVVEGDLESGRFLATYWKDGRIVGALAMGMPPRQLRPWREAVAGGTASGDRDLPGASSPGGRQSAVARE